MGEIWIGITGFYATDNPNPGLAVARALRQADPSWRILALVYDRFATGAFAEGLIDAHAVVPYPGAGPAVLLTRLASIVHGHPLDVVIPTVDAEQPHYVGARARLRRLGIRTLLPAARALGARAKRRLPALGRRAGVGVPPTVVLPGVAAVDRASLRARYPQILKGPLVDSLVTNSPQDFRVGARELAAQWGYPLLAQPMIAGEEYDVAAVVRGGEVLATAVMKKLGTTNKGTAWAGVTVDEPRAVSHLRRLVRTLRWDGAIEAEFLAAPDGTLVCFEINPRFPSWIALAADAGANLPELLVRLALDQPADGGAHAQPGRLFARTVTERLFRGNPLDTLTERPVRRRLLGDAVLTPPVLDGTAAGRGAVGVTGLHAADNPSPGVTVARSLRAAAPAARLVGFTHEILATGAYIAGLWSEIRVLPFPAGAGSDYADVLIKQCRAAGIECLLPTLDIEIPLVAWLAPRLAAAGVATLVPPLAALQRATKTRLPALADEGFRVPRTRTVAGYGALAEVRQQLRLPFVVKGPLADAKVVRTDEEAEVVAGRLAATWGFPLLAQEYVAGEEFGIAAVADHRHRVLGTVIVRKEIRTANGNTWSGTAVADTRLAALADRFAEALGWVGPFELEVIRHPRRGTFLIEVNPRFPGWIYLSAGTGANLPWLAVRAARGERVRRVDGRAGTVYVRMAWDVTASIDRMGVLAVEGKVNGDVS